MFDDEVKKRSKGIRVRTDEGVMVVPRKLLDKNWLSTLVKDKQKMI